jgi:hypothetical protein
MRRGVDIQAAIQTALDLDRQTIQALYAREAAADS